ncbi:MAG TPA: thioesterase family protein [Ktedonobacterales bacterium]|nr:thioesterase family protein [Ktedonobacterales bacterium]
MSTRFDRATAITPAGAGRFTAQMDPEWFVLRGPNGGYLAAVILRALTAALDDVERAPRALTVHFLAPAEAGALAIQVTIERAGKTMASIAARVSQGEHLIALVLATFAAPHEGLTLPTAPLPAVPPPAELPPLAPHGAITVPFVRQYQYRTALGAPPLSGAAEARVGGWLRLAEPRLADAPLVAAYSDAWLPSIYPRLREPAMTPTLDLTIHFRARLPLEGAAPEDEYLAIFESRHAAEGYFEEDGAIWSRSGVLIAQSRQLALLRALPR